jgi:glycosyltransferase involved in cell wall biosynthesis
VLTETDADSYKKLSIIVPVYDERNTVVEIVRRMRAVDIPLEREIVLVDDGSTDGTRDVLQQLTDSTVRVVHHPSNRGKGASVRTGLEQVTGDLVLIQDADLEYDPSEYPRLLAPIEAGRADVVFGSRFAGSAEHRVQHFWHQQGNRLLTLISNVFTGLNVSDMATCYKAFHRRVVPSLSLESKGFGIDAEITAKVARGGFRVFEVPVSYFGRSHADGKKIRMKDGFAALGALVRHTLFAGRKR